MNPSVKRTAVLRLLFWLRWLGLVVILLDVSFDRAVWADSLSYEYLASAHFELSDDDALQETIYAEPIVSDFWQDPYNSQLPLTIPLTYDSNGISYEAELHLELFLRQSTQSGTILPIPSERAEAWYREAAVFRDNSASLRFESSDAEGAVTILDYRVIEPGGLILSAALDISLYDSEANEYRYIDSGELEIQVFPVSYAGDNSYAYDDYSFWYCGGSNDPNPGYYEDDSYDCTDNSSDSSDCSGGDSSTGSSASGCEGDSTSSSGDSTSCAGDTSSGSSGCEGDTSSASPGSCALVRLNKNTQYVGRWPRAKIPAGQRLVDFLPILAILSGCGIYTWRRAWPRTRLKKNISDQTGQNS
jgi:hypothetical protein